eukprot:5583259-Pyramimonas_sp.AAC.1
MQVAIFDISRLGIFRAGIAVEQLVDGKLINEKYHVHNKRFSGSTQTVYLFLARDWPAASGGKEGERRRMRRYINMGEPVLNRRCAIPLESAPSPDPQRYSHGEAGGTWRGTGEEWRGVKGRK